MGNLEIEIAYTSIPEELQDYKELDKLLRILEDNWELKSNPAISNNEIEKHELATGITLPQEYRRFLTEVRNGGNGPCEQLFSIEDAIQESGGKSELLKKFNPESEKGGILLIDTDHIVGGAGIVINGPDRGTIWIYNVEIGQFWFPAIENFNRLNLELDRDIEKISAYLRKEQPSIPRVEFYSWYKPWLVDTVKNL